MPSNLKNKIVKKLKTLLLVFFVTLAHAGLAQKDSSQTSVPFVFKLSSSRTPLVILKSDKRTMELDPRNDEIFDMKSIAAKWVKSITVLKDQNAKDIYGERGANGVLIVQLVDNYVFSKALNKKIGVDE